LPLALTRPPGVGPSSLLARFVAAAASDIDALLSFLLL